MSNELPTAYQQVIHLTKYAKWNEKLGRRESWEETVDRYTAFIDGELREHNNFMFPTKDLNEIRNYILDLKVMPSMRALMTAGPAAKRDNISMYNCFGGNEKVITQEYGPVALSEIAGEKVTAWTSLGWKSAEAKYFGEQSLNRITFKPHSDRTNHRVVVDATPNHRWILSDGSETLNLSIGDRVSSNPVTKVNNEDYDDGVRHGIIFGDGTLNSINKNNGNHYHHVVMYGQQADIMLSYFEKFTYAESRSGAATAYLTSKDNLKEFPVGKNSDYIAGFIQGWIFADGNQINSDSIKLDSGKPESYEWLLDNAAYGGYIVVGVNYTNKPTNFGPRTNPLARITLKASKEFTVESISALDEQSVFCLVVPETGDFTLASGLLTGNCSFIAVDTPRAFDEAMYILMNGTGVGFSVESEYVSKLPIIAEHFEESSTVIHVADSKGGWARALKELIAMLYSGQVPTWDVSKVRPRGARLKTFGGRASGPEPLVDLFKFVIQTFKLAVGRRLTPLEAHDMMCKVGEIVVVGGVRRSALISLSDLSDYEMAKSKAGEWYNGNGQRALANNSAVYKGKPTPGVFMKEWRNLYESKSGERGLFNLASAQMIAGLNGRRDASKVKGTNPCAEILLRNNEFCNLSSVVIRPEDTLEDLIAKVKIATVIGTIQSTFTRFKYLRNIWKENCEDERLLGVSLSGQMGHPVLNGSQGLEAMAAWLETMKDAAIAENVIWAEKLGVKQAAAITCVKPEGNSSQLTAVSSGMHTWHSEYYIRTIRADNKDPLTVMLKDLNVVNEPDVMNAEKTTVFSFPIKAPNGAFTRDSLSAVEHLNIWLTYQKSWCEHKPSITVTVKEDEWLDVAAWVYSNFEWMSGVSFLPHSDHSYKQAPYQECTKEEFEDLVMNTPMTIDWSLLSFYEVEDTTTSAQELACTGSNSCDIVEVGSVA